MCVCMYVYMPAGASLMMAESAIFHSKEEIEDLGGSKGDTGGVGKAGVI